MRILVLEDDELRIRWLARRLPQADIHWTPGVDRFLELAHSPTRRWDLILMDHDLGMSADGRDAARALNTSAPIIVWSANWLEMGRVMERILRRRGQPVIGWWYFGHPELWPQIRRAVAA